MGKKSKKKDIVYGEKLVPTLYKLIDDFSKEVNNKLRMRGCSKGLVSVWSEINQDCLQAQKCISRAYKIFNSSEKESLLDKSYLNVEDLCVSVRYLYTNRCLTIGEIGILTEKADEIRKQLNSWMKALREKATEG